MSSRYELPVPLGVREFVGACILQSRSLIEIDGALESVTFVGKVDGDGIMFPAISYLPKEKAENLICLAAEGYEADYILHIDEGILHIDEGWAYQAETEAETDALTVQYAEVRAMPSAIDIVAFQLGTHAGQYYAHAKRETVHDAAGNRHYTLGNVSFELVPVVRTLYGLLPAKGRRQ